MLLAIDTSTHAVGAAVCAGGEVVSRCVRDDARRHTEHLAPAIERALDLAGIAPRQLARVAVGVGPGPFTGLRVGVVTATVLGRTLDLPVHGVCSLDVLATQVRQQQPDWADDTPFLVASDARRREVYWASYEIDGARPGGIRRTGGPQVGSAGSLPQTLRELPAWGRGADLYPDDLTARPGVRDVDPGRLGLLVEEALAGVAGDGLLLPPRPLYLRRPDAAVPGAPKTVAP